MKKLLAFAAVTILAAGAMAQVDGDPDGIGVYFDEGATTFCASTAAPFESVTAYVCLTNCSSPAGVSGWEASLSEVGGTAGAFTLVAGTNFFSPPDFQVGIGTTNPLPYAPVIVLATWTGFVQTPATVVEFYINGLGGSGIPLFGVGNDAGDLRELQSSVGFPFGGASARINGDCDIVANDDATWSNVKTMFR